MGLEGKEPEGWQSSVPRPGHPGAGEWKGSHLFQGTVEVVRCVHARVCVKRRELNKG